MSKIKETNLKTVKKWQKEFEAEFKCDICNRKVWSLRRVTCKRWESQIKSSKNFSSKWLSPGATTINKDCVKKHVLSLQHQEAVKLSKKNKLGSEAYKQLVVKKHQLGKA